MKVLQVLMLVLILTGCGEFNNATSSTVWRVTSSAFEEGAGIPRKFTCSGENISPPLEWRGAPAGSKSFALIMQDPDAPGGTFTHWVAYDIPASQTGIAEGAMTAGMGGDNSAGGINYMGPCPPSGEHRYIFTVYALDTALLNPAAGATQTQVTAAMQGHILAQASLMGKYKK